MKKRYITLFSIGLVFMILPFLINTYSFIRIISLLLGIILVVVSLIIKKKRNIFYIILIPVLLIVFTYGIDTLLFYTLKNIPIYSYRIQSNKSMNTYNSFFYRVFDCDNKLVLDYGYKKNYVCSKDLLKMQNINSFMQDADASYKKYHGKFVYIYGKISKITGTEYLELASFTQAESLLNGYVNFNLDNILNVEVNEDLSQYRIYDYIKVIGRVDSIKDGKITLVDSVLYESDIYKEYSFELQLSDDKKLTNLVKEKDYYYYAINSVNVKYDDSNIYELSYLLLDERIKFSDLIQDLEYTSFKDEEEIELARLYKLEKFNILKCQNDKIIVVSKNVNADADICSLNID